MRPSWYRLATAIFAGNALGIATNWLSADVFVPWLWSGTSDATRFSVRVGLLALSAVLLAAPPVLVGAFGAWLARRDHLWVGLACGLWGLTLIGSVPPTYPIAPGVWYVPAVLVILSSALGGYMLDLREQASSVAGRG